MLFLLALCIVPLGCFLLPLVRQSIRIDLDPKGCSDLQEALGVMQQKLNTGLGLTVLIIQSRIKKDAKKCKG